MDESVSTVYEPTPEGNQAFATSLACRGLAEKFATCLKDLIPVDHTFAFHQR